MSCQVLPKILSLAILCLINNKSCKNKRKKKSCVPCENRTAQKKEREFSPNLHPSLRRDVWLDESLFCSRWVASWLLIGRWMSFHQPITFDLLDSDADSLCLQKRSSIPESCFPSRSGFSVGCPAQKSQMKIKFISSLSCVKLYCSIQNSLSWIKGIAVHPKCSQNTSQSLLKLIFIIQCSALHGTARIMNTDSFQNCDPRTNILDPLHRD